MSLLKAIASNNFTLFSSIFSKTDGTFRRKAAQTLMSNCNSRGLDVRIIEDLIKHGANPCIFGDNINVVNEPLFSQCVNHIMTSTVISETDIQYYLPFAVKQNLWDVFLYLIQFIGSEQYREFRIKEIPSSWKYKLIAEKIVLPEFFFTDTNFSQTIAYDSSIEHIAKPVAESCSIIDVIKPYNYSQKQKDVMLLYSHNGDKLLNYYIRNNYKLSDELIDYYREHYMWFAEFVPDFATDDDKFIEDYILNIYDELLNTFVVSFDKDIVLYRGLAEIMPYFKGQKIKLTGFISATCDKEIAYGFATPNIVDDCTVIELIIPRGFFISIIYKFSRYSAELEFLLPDHTNMTIKSISETTSIVPNADKPQKILTVVAVVSIDQTSTYKYRSKPHSFRDSKNIELKTLSHDEIQYLLNEGRVASFFQWWKDTQDVSTFTYSLDNYVFPEVLEWWLHKSGLPLYYTEKAIDLLSESGAIEVLDWWLHSGLKLQYSEDAIDRASQYGQINSLNWWKNSRLPLKYTSDAIDLASAYNKIHILDWWKDSGLLLRYSEVAMDGASLNESIDALEWWKAFHEEKGAELRYSENAMKQAIELKHTEVINWWKSSGLPIKMP